MSDDDVRDGRKVRLVDYLAAWENEENARVQSAADAVNRDMAGQSLEKRLAEVMVRTKGHHNPRRVREALRGKLS